MRRSVLIMSAIVASLLSGVRGMPVYAVGRRVIAMDLVVLMAQGHHLSVFDQISVAKTTGAVRIGLIEGAQHVRVINGREETQGQNAMTLRLQGGRVTVRYRVPWNGRSASLSLINPERVSTLVLLVKPTITLPSVLNPVLQEAGQGRLSGVAHSPTFDEYAASRVPAGQKVPIVLEHQVEEPMAVDDGNHPVMARVFELLAGIASMGALLVALYWRPVRPSADPGLEELARLIAAFRRGELDAEAYQTARNIIVSRIQAAEADHG